MTNTRLLFSDCFRFELGGKFFVAERGQVGTARMQIFIKNGSDFHEWTDTALVLHVGKFRETDLWIRLLALEQGLITAFAFEEVEVVAASRGALTCSM